MARSWSGAAQSGSRDYGPEDVERVLDALPRGRQEAVTSRTITVVIRAVDRASRTLGKISKASGKLSRALRRGAGKGKC